MALGAVVLVVLAGSASADGRHACADAVERAIAALGGDAGLVLFFTAGDVDPDAAASEAHNAAGDAHVAGMSGTGVIGADGLMKTGCAAIAFSPSLEIGVQVNGKLRAQVRVPAGASDDEHEAAARADAKIAAALDVKTVRKVVVVPGRIVNFVVG